MRKYLTLVLILLSLTPLHAQTLRITEILATNVNGIVDEDGTHQGWIEIWNTSPTTKVQCAPPTSPSTTTKITDGTTTWTIPNVDIMPDERVIVWASGKNRLVSTAPLHTNFTLSAGGGTLRIIRTVSGVDTVWSEITYPAQQPDISYGRDEWDIAVIPTQVGFYSEPTPEERNNFTGPGVAGKVSFDITSKAYTAGTLQVTLSQVTPDPAAEIRYTVNGTVPIATSTLYTGPITPTGTQQIRARVFKPGLLPGETESNAYLLLDATTANFNTTMPIIVLTSFGSGISDTLDTASYMWVWQPAAPDNRSRLTNPPVLVSRTVVDKRGSSTLGNPKFNLNMEFRKSRDDDDQNRPFLGMPSHSDWVLHAPYAFDRSDLHNPLAYAMSNVMGRYAPRTKQAEVFIDVNGGALTGTTSGDYFGIYNVMEKIRRDNDRIDIVNMRKYDNDAVGKTGGFIWKVDRLDAGDSGFNAGGQNMAYYDPKEVEIKSPQRAPQAAYLTGFINTFNSVLQSGSWNNPTTGYAKYLDVDAAIDHHLVNTWCFNVDALRLSGYWVKDRGINQKMMPLPVWDFDRALSSTDDRDRRPNGVNENPNVWRSTIPDLGTDFFNYVWWNRLFQDINFYQKYIDRWQSLRRGELSQTNLDALIDSLNAELDSQAITRDVSRWGQTKRSWTNPVTGVTTSASQAAEVRRLKDYLQLRANFMDTQFVGPVTASVAEGNVAVGTQVTLSGPANATIYYTLNGADPRPFGGAAPPAGSVLTYTPGTPITITETTRLRARAHNPTHTALTGANNPPLVSRWGGLTNVRYSVDARAASGNLAVTELNFNPPGPLAAELTVNPRFEGKDFEFIELKNIGAEPIDLFGAQFTNGITFSFTGTNAISVPPGGYFIVASNPTAFAARYGASALPVLGPWKGDLSNQGERLVIKSFSGATILDFTYDDGWFPIGDGGGGSFEYVGTDFSNGSYNNPANWRDSTEVFGSPGSAGVGTVPGIVINEILTNSSLPRVDAIELFNQTPDPIDISGWYVSDVGSALSTEEYKKYRIPNGTVIPGGGYYVLTEVNFNPNGAWNPTPGTPGANEFAFDADRGENAWLISADGTGKLLRFVDHVEFRAARADETWGRFPNGTGNFYPMLQRTLLDENSAATPRPGLGAANSAPRFGPLIISEIQPTPEGDNPDLEYVEIYNPTETDQPLANWRLRGSVDFDFTTQTIPAGTSLIVTAFDPADTVRADAFRTFYDSPTAALAGPWVVANRLQPDGTVTLYRAETPPPAEPTFFPQTVEDEAHYDSGGAWPDTADGDALRRLLPFGLGDDPASWGGRTPYPGGPFNQLPVAVADSLHVELGNPMVLSVTANDTDPEADVLSVTAVGAPSKGAAEPNGANISYTPGPTFDGNDSFTYTINDGFGGVASGTITLVNAMPVAVPDALHASLVGGVATLDVLANDTDPDSDERVILAVQTPTNGTATTDGQSISYTPGPNFTGSDQFTYTLGDKHGGTATGQVTLSNMAPMAVNDSFHQPLNGGAIAVDVLANDSDPDGTDQLTIVGVGDATNGTVETNGTMAAFTPDPSFNGNASFSYTVSDGHGGTASATATLTNAAPVAVNDTADTLANAATTVTVLANDTDPDSDQLALVSASNGAFGTTTVNGASVTYTPGGSYLGLDTFSYTIADGHGGTAVGTVTVRANGLTGRTEATTGEPVPGADGMFYASFQVPAIGNDGLISWLSTVKGTGVKSKLMLIGGNPATALFGKNDTIPQIPNVSVSGVRFSTIKTPVVDGSGRVIFLSTLAGSGVSKKNNTAVFAKEPGGDLALVARLGDPAPDSSGRTYTQFTSVSASGGETAIFAKLSSKASGAWAWDGTANRRVLDTGGSIETPLGQKTVSSVSLLGAVTGSPGHPRSHRAGEMAISVGLTDRSKGVALAQLAGETWTAKALALSGQSTGIEGTWKTFGPAALAAPGTVVLSATFAGTSRTADSAIVLLGGTDPVLIAREGSDSPIAGTKYKSFTNPVANIDGSIAFTAKISGAVATKDDVLVFRDSAGNASVVAREMDPIPDQPGLLWKKIVSFALPSSPGSGPIFLAQIAGSGVTAKNNLGLFAKASDGSIVMIARTGVSFMGKTPTKLVLLNALPPVQGSGRSFDDTQRVAFLATYTNRSQSIEVIRVP